MQQRVQKLLILAGDQGAFNQPRDFKKIVQVIVEQYLSSNNTQASKKITQLLTLIISKIPLKHHIYAGLTAKISILSKQLSYQIIDTTITLLQQSLSNLQLYQSINIINYLSQLMNISLLNSLTFMNILEDIIDKIEGNINNNNINMNMKRFLLIVLIRVLPVCISSLSQKLFQDLKKFMDLVDNQVNFCFSSNIVNNVDVNLFNYMKKLINKGEIINFSFMDRLNQNFVGLEQFTIKRKLKVQLNMDKVAEWTPVEYFHINRSYEDELYRQFCQQQGRVHIIILQQLIQIFYPKNTILSLKINNYLTSIPTHKQSFLYKLVISYLISKALRSSHPYVQQSLLLTIISYLDSSSQNSKIQQQSSQPLPVSHITRHDVSSLLSSQIYLLFSKAQSMDYNTLINVSNLISFLINNWKQSQFEYQQFVQNEQDKFVKRRVLLMLILQKVKFLNYDNFQMPQGLKKYGHYDIPSKLTYEHEYQSQQDITTLNQFQSLLKSKSPSQSISIIITSQQRYQIFLQSLFRRTSLSLTHLKTLTQRYCLIFNQFQQYDWTLINKIRNFWNKSYLNRQIYMQLMISKGFVSFQSYVKYIEQLKGKTDFQMVWIKVELGELIQKVGKKNAK